MPQAVQLPTNKIYTSMFHPHTTLTDSFSIILQLCNSLLGNGRRNCYQKKWSGAQLNNKKAQVYMYDTGVFLRNASSNLYLLNVFKIVSDTCVS